MRARFFLAPLAVAFGLAFACAGRKSDAQSATAATYTPPATTGSILPSAPTNCQDTAFDPAGAIAKEPGVFNSCLTVAGNPNLCGSAKIAVKLGKDGRVQSAEVANSTFPPPVTDCIKARLAAMQFACPTDDSAVYTVPVGLPIGAACPSMGSQ